MSDIKVKISGATGMVGEGVLFECLQNAKVSEVLIVNRRHYELQHPKLKELIVPLKTAHPLYQNRTAIIIYENICS